VRWRMPADDSSATATISLAYQTSEPRETLLPAAFGTSYKRKVLAFAFLPREARKAETEIGVNTALEVWRRTRDGYTHTIRKYRLQVCNWLARLGAVRKDRDAGS
jgi:hypothetical protein